MNATARPTLEAARARLRRAGYQGRTADEARRTLAQAIALRDYNAPEHARCILVEELRVELEACRRAEASQ